MTYQNDPRNPPKSPASRKFRPSVIIDDQMPKRLIVQLDTYDISPDRYEAAVRAWLEQSSPPSEAFTVARAVLSAIKASR